MKMPGLIWLSQVFSLTHIMSHMHQRHTVLLAVDKNGSLLLLPSISQAARDRAPRTVSNAYCVECEEPSSGKVCLSWL